MVGLWLGDAQGRIPEIMEKPIQGCEARNIVTSDDFSGSKLKLGWQWNHNPVNNAWSLSERPGYLRLKTSRKCENIFTAPNTISQRMTGPRCSGMVAMDISRMKEGDVAGLSAFNGDAALLSVKMVDGKKQLIMSTESVSLTNKEKLVTGVKCEVKEIVALKQRQQVIYLRIEGDFRLNHDLASCFYSLDGKEWQKIGTDFKMSYDYRLPFYGQSLCHFQLCYAERGRICGR